MQQQIAKVAIPDDLAFSDLRLARMPDGSVSFEWSVIERICHSNDLPMECFRDAHEDNVAGLLVGWYQAHRQNGGAPDSVAEDLIAETQAEDQAGQLVSHHPGRA